MTELIQKAIDKIDKEAEAINAPAVTVVASHIIDVYLKSDENAQKALDEEKTLKKCWDDVKNNARKQASGGCAMVSDDAVFEWVKEYYGFAQSAGTDEKIINLFDCL